jgi:hypothetical protein
MRKAHGQHNLDLAKLLLDEGDYNDWVITASFYSSVHFVEHALFPLIEHGIEYVDFNDYWQNTSNHSKHTCKKILVKNHLKSVAAIYRELLDDCHSSRYNNYIVTPYNAQQAKIKADKIKATCLLKKP